jgi:hypothetical protein
MLTHPSLTQLSFLQLLLARLSVVQLLWTQKWEGGLTLMLYLHCQPDQACICGLAV